MDEFDDLGVMQRLADYRQLRKLIRASAIGSLIFGILNIGIAVILFDQHFLNGLLALIGLFMLVEGLWNLVAPSAGGIIVDGLGLLLVGVWNVVITVLNLAAGGAGGISPQFLVFGLFQIGWGVHRFLQYPKAYAAFAESFTDEEVKELDKRIQAITKAKAKDAPDIITFQTRSFFQQLEWKGQLGGTAALFVAQPTNDAVVARRDDVDVEVKGKVLIGKTLKVRLRLRDRKWGDGRMSPKAHERYRAWKEGEEVLEAEEG